VHDTTRTITWPLIRTPRAQAVRQERRLLRACAAFVVACIAQAAFCQSIRVTADRPDGVYAVGDTVHWTVQPQDGMTDLTYMVFPNQGNAPSVTGKVSGELIDYTFDKPGTVLLRVKGKKADGKEANAVGGAVAAPEQIQPSAPRPTDFDDFWAAKIRELRAIPMGEELSPVDSGVSGVKYSKVTLNNINGTHIRGQIARPDKPGKFPGLLQVQYAGVYGLPKDFVTGRAREGWLALNISAHDIPIDESPAFYKAQSDGPLKNYPAIGNDDRETSYFLRMYLSCVRAVDYLKTQPDWDGKTLIVIGGSMGGMQSLVTAGLCPDDVTAAIADVPAGCDMLGPKVGRRGGYPSWWELTRGQDWKTPHDPDKVHEASRYFDVVNFAPKIQAHVLIGVGLLDDVCPAAGVYAAFNQIPSKNKQIVPLPSAGHMNEHDSHKPFNDLQWGVWMPKLLKGQLPSTE